jgi:hypothetical protein
MPPLLSVSELAASLSYRDNAIPDVRRYLKTYIDVVVYCAKDASGYHTPRVWFKAVDEAA